MRHVRLILQPRLLEAVNLNRRSPFDAVVRNPVVGAIDREALSARVKVPALLPGVTFFAPSPQPPSRIVAAPGDAPDLFYHPGGYAPHGDYSAVYPTARRPNGWRPKAVPRPQRWT